MKMADAKQRARKHSPCPRSIVDDERPTLKHHDSSPSTAANRSKSSPLIRIDPVAHRLPPKSLASRPRRSGKRPDVSHTKKGQFFSSRDSAAGQPVQTDYRLEVTGRRSNLDHRLMRKGCSRESIPVQSQLGVYRSLCRRCLRLRPSLGAAWNELRTTALSAYKRRGVVLLLRHSLLLHSTALPAIMDISLGAEERYSLITRRLQLQNGWGGQKLWSLVAEGKPIKYLWGTAPTGKPHMGYLIPLIKFADFIHAGGEVTMELLDWYAFLVNYRFPWDQVCHRRTYYRCLFSAALKAIGVPMSRVSMVDGSSYQGTPEFVLDLWKLCALCSQQDVRDTGAEVGASTMLSPMLSPLLQELAEEYHGVHVEIGGLDQRGIFNLGEQFLPELGYEKRVHVMNQMLPSLTGGKMSASHPDHTKLTLLDDEATIERKLAGASCPMGIVEGNGVLPIVEHILMPIGELRMRDKTVNGHGADKGSGSPFAAQGAPDGTLLSVSGACEAARRDYSTYDELQRDYLAGRIEPVALKAAVAMAINQILRPIRDAYAGNEVWREADRMGYPEDWPAAAS
ncbi:hypothetical protein XA68_17343 [Ophiocordyceps unilateralis]|uniref:tyrosine--tRNA ligase n=1 Tax=Ophiocordyceps unilateralis TaxID=268505 RepID=A0A2A9PJ83_OPHUN|nr:hypothetical protein XA68_17343 [Ophiocordyceps unilateralis]